MRLVPHHEIAKPGSVEPGFALLNHVNMIQRLSQRRKETLMTVIALPART
jgi:hypothetical protein